MTTGLIAGARDRLIRLAEAHPGWVLGFQGEVWWSRLARPGLHAWAGGEPLRLHEPATDPDPDPDPEAPACYGLLRGRRRPATACCAARPGGCCCGSSGAGRSAR
ncbi:hypothetical protein [Tautonia plasticadhaerens]|uniref:hypothetical protein n=1 Tax=Tautonia plasticadhaerens TaxID=2527974 RepID=UPI001E467D29|nr:hypothetical protein [Tautonia plasticadhaerens]